MKKLFNKIKLPNGLIVATKSIKRKTLRVAIRVHFGAVHEKKGEEGLAHFLEHSLASAGSKLFSVKESDNLRSELDTFNAGTSFNYTVYSADILPEDLDKFLKFSSGFLFQPQFNKKRVNEERKRIIREIVDEKSSSEYRLTRKVIQRLYGDHPHTRSICGKERVIKQVNVEGIRKLHTRGYHPNNMDIILIGNIPKDFLFLIKKYFGSVPRGADTRKTVPNFKQLKKTSIIHEYVPEDKNLDDIEESSANIDLNFIMNFKNKKEYFALKLLSFVLGESTNSRLFRRLSMDEGLVYHISAYYNGSPLSGNLCVDADVPAKKIKESVKIIFEEIGKLSKEGITQEEFEREQKKIKYEYARMFDSGNGWLELISLDLDKNFTPKNFLEGYKGLNLKLVNQVAKKYLPESQKKAKYLLVARDPLHEK